MSTNPVPPTAPADALGRRDFLGRMGAAALAALAPGLGLGLDQVEAQAAAPMPGPVPGPTPGAPPGLTPDALLAAEEPYFAEVAKLFRLAEEHKYLVASQKGSMPVPVLAHFKEGLDHVAADPFPVYLDPSAETRATIARGYGARVDEIAISRNTTDGVSQVLSGIDWHPGDEILCSTLEYPNCVATVRRVAQRFGLVIRQFGVPGAPGTEAEEIVASAARQLHPGRTRLMFFSCPTQPTGIALPVRRLAHLAQAHGVITLVDGAHYGGMFDPRLDETGIDFWSIAGHKWQCGPGGTGILYLRNAALPANAGPLPHLHLIRSGALDAPTDGSRPEGFDIGAALSLYGFPESADWRALGEVCALWDRMGRGRIEAYTLALAAYARGRLTDAFGEACLLQPARDPELLSGIVAFNPFPDPARRRDLDLAEALQRRLLQECGYHVGCGALGPKGLTRAPDADAAAYPPGSIPNRDPVTNRPAPGEVPLRIGTPLWCDRADLDRFVSDCQAQVGYLLA